MEEVSSYTRTLSFHVLSIMSLDPCAKQTAGHCVHVGLSFTRDYGYKKIGKFLILGCFLCGSKVKVKVLQLWLRNF